MSAATRTPDQITAEIVETRERLAATIDQLVVRVKPKNLAMRRLDAVKSKFVGPDGPIVKNIGIVAGSVVGFVVLVTVLRKAVG